MDSNSQMDIDMKMDVEPSYSLDLPYCDQCVSLLNSNGKISLHNVMGHWYALPQPSQSQLKSIPDFFFITLV